MKKLLRSFTIGGVAMTVTLSAHAWPDETIATFIDKGRASTTLDIDNDTLLLTGSDRFYTSGVRASRSYRLRRSEGWESLGWRVGQQLYTPSTIRLRPEQITALDHPYAGWLYAGMFHRREYGFFRFGLRAVGHDATLQGGWLSGTEARTVNPKRLTGEMELGWQWLSPQWAVRLSVVRRGNEIQGLSESDGRQDFLRLSIAFTR